LLGDDFAPAPVGAETVRVVGDTPCDEPQPVKTSVATIEPMNSPRLIR
jgi:hypothetical protein